MSFKTGHKREQTLVTSAELSPPYSSTLYISADFDHFNRNFSITFHTVRGRIRE